MDFVHIYVMLMVLMLGWITLSAAQNTIASLIEQRSELSRVSEEAVSLPVYLYWLTTLRVWSCLIS